MDIVAADAKYGNRHFMEALKSHPCGKVLRLRNDRALYRPAPVGKPGKGGRPRKHGSRFAFKEAETWDEPAELTSIQHPRWGSVKIRRWNGLHAWKSIHLEFDVMQLRVHLEKSEPPAPLWLAWLPLRAMPDGVVGDIETIWRAYQRRWMIESSIRLRPAQDLRQIAAVMGAAAILTG